MKSEYKRDVLFLGVALGVVLLDQLTKWVALSTLSNPVSLIGSFLQFVLVKNTGAGFGLAQGHNFLLILLTSVILIVLLVYYAKVHREKPVSAIFTALIGGGAVGNLVDRIRIGYVVDFIDVSFWPTFNVADAAITVGVIGLIYYVMRHD